MRKLTKLEKTLGISLGVTVFLLANLFGLSALLRQKRAVQLEFIKLNGEKEDASVWLADREMWLQRKAWLDKEQPKIAQAEAAQPEFFQELQKSARAQNLAIDEQGFGEVSQMAHYQSISVRMKVSGTLENVTKWLASIQKPQSFQAITNFSLRSEKDPPKVNLELEIARWYSPSNG